MYCIIDIYIVQENYKNEKGSKENMANIKSKLEQYRSLVEESIEVDIKIKNIKREIDELKALGEVIDTVTGGNGGIQHFTIKVVPTPAYTNKLNRLQLSLITRQQLLDKIESQKNDIESFICRIENSMIRRMLEYRYMEAMKWSEVAKKMGKTYTADYCRVTCDRFLKGYNK